MALDERQQQIKEGAGLEEARLNVEFIDWLRRWSTPVLVVVAVVVLGYVGYERWQLSRKAEVDRAFTQLDAVTESQNPSPDSLRGLGEDFEGIRAVGHIARLTAADLYLQAARRGIRPGATLTPEGTVADAGDLLNDEQRSGMLADAEGLYLKVLSDTESTQSAAIHAISASYGLAAVAESRGDAPAAANHYKKVVDLAQRAGFKSHVDIATRRMASLPELKMPTLYASADLPKLPWAAELEAPPVPPPALPGPQEPTPVDPSADPAAPAPAPAETGNPPADPQTPEPQPADPQPGNPAPASPPASEPTPPSSPPLP